MRILLAVGSSPALRDRRKHYWIVDPRPGDKRKTTGASEGDRSQARPRGCPGDFDPTRATAQPLKETELVAGAFKVQLQYLDVLDPKDIETAFRAASKGRADAVVMMVAGAVADSHRTQIVDLAVKSRLPSDVSARIHM